MKRIFFLLVLMLPLAACGGGDTDTADSGAKLEGFEEGTTGGDAARPQTALSYLRDYEGQYPNQSDLWTKEPLGSRLQSMLGSRFSAFQQNMQEVGPAMVEGDYLYVTGNRQNQGGDHSAVFLADLVGDNIKVWLLTNGRIKEYVEKEGQAMKLPNEAAMYIANWTPGS